MKKLLLIIMLCTLIISQGFAQTQTVLAKNFDKWSVGLNLSVNSPNGDARDKKSSLNLISPKIGYGLSLSRQISHFTGLELNYIKGNLGLSVSPYAFDSKIQQIDGRFRVNFTNGQILANYKKTQLFMFVGLGMFNYQTTFMTDTGAIDMIESDWVKVIPVGVGFKQRLTQNTSVNLEVGYNQVNTDRLDGVNVSYSGKDGYTNVKLGFQYTFGNKNKPLEWDEPLAYFKPSQEHSVDTVVIVKKETIIVGDTASKKPVKSLTIFYDTNDHLINGIYGEDLQKILNQLQQNKDSYIEVLAFCDSTGTEKANNKLVLRRSRIVTDYFINNGIDGARINVYNYGMEFAKDPILSKDRKVIIKYWKSLGDKNSSMK